AAGRHARRPTGRGVRGVVVNGGAVNDPTTSARAGATLRVLGIETSCDETSAAVLVGDGDHAEMRSLVILSQDVHRIFGGVVPEIASRAHLTALVPVVERALADASLGLDEIDAVAVTYA